MPHLIRPPKKDEQTAAEGLEQTMSTLRAREKEDLTEIAAAKAGFPYIDLQGAAISPETLGLLDKATSLQSNAVVFARAGNNIRIGALDPLDPHVGAAVAKLENDDGLTAESFIISPQSLAYAQRGYGRVIVPKNITGVEISDDEIHKAQASLSRLNDLRETVARLPVTELLATFIAGAINFRATDIHFEAEETEVRVRYRIDGILHLLATLPHSTWSKIAMRVKTLAKLKINISNIPQDGTFQIQMSDNKIDVRISILPSTYGESIAMRLLMASSTDITLDQLGLRGKAYDLIQTEMQRPNGMIIATGPTGAGKSTTLYAMLKQLNTDEVKIITLEDPIEYRLPGVIQSQVNPDKNYSFANGLRSILRQDPDVIMVGEIRDLPTAETSIQAALTGHLVLSTLHTNSAAGGIPRFLSLGAKNFLLAPALNIIMAQRLVRKICDQCTVADTPAPELLQKAEHVRATLSNTSGVTITDEPVTYKKGNGCDHCHGIGYYGRIGIFEVLALTPPIEQLILTGTASEYDIQKAATDAGMLTMAQDGVLKAADGLTTLDEVFRVVD